MTTAFLPDPGGIFDSDVHRRVAAFMPPPEDDAIAFDDLMIRLGGDEPTLHSGLASADHLQEVLDDLAAAGDVSKHKDGTWRKTKAGTEKVNGSVANEPPPLEGEKLAKAEAANQAELEATAEAERDAAAERVDRLKAELAEAEQEAG